MDPKDLKTICKDKEITSQLSKKADVADMVLMGKYYKLPVKLQAFLDDGWQFVGQIKDNPYDFETLVMNANTYIHMTLMKDYKAISLKVVNSSDKATPMSEEKIDEKKSAVLEFKRNSTIGSKKYPESKYKNIISDLKKISLYRRC